MRSSPDDGDRFTVQERIVLELVAAGISHEAAGVGIHRSAKFVQRLLKRPEARDLVRTIQAERLAQTVGELGLPSVEAAHLVRAEMRGERSGYRLQAASLGLRYFGDLRAAAQQAAIRSSRLCGSDQSARSSGGSP